MTVIKQKPKYDYTFRVKEDYIDMRERENRNLTYEYYKKQYPLLSRFEIIEIVEDMRKKQMTIEEYKDKEKEEHKRAYEYLKKIYNI